MSDKKSTAKEKLTYNPNTMSSNFSGHKARLKKIMREAKEAKKRLTREEFD